MKEITELVSNVLDFMVMVMTLADEEGETGIDLIFSGPDPKYVVSRCKFILSCVLWEKIRIILDSQMSEAFGENKWNKLELWQ